MGVIATLLVTTALAGVVMACAIALHNVPKGMTIGASYACNEGVMGNAALVLAVLIGLHNIPKGMAVSVPLIGGGMAKWKAVLITAATGIPTINKAQNRHLSASSALFCGYRPCCSPAFG